MTNFNSQPSKNTATEDPKRVSDVERGIPPVPEEARQFAMRAKGASEVSAKRKTTIVLAGGAAVIALLLFVFLSFPEHNAKPTKPQTPRQAAADHSATADSEKSLFPVTESQQSASRNSDSGFVGEQDLERTASRATAQQPTAQSLAGDTLGSIPPFDSDQNIQPAPAPSSGGDETIEQKKERDQASLVFIRKAETASDVRNSEEQLPNLDSSFGLAVGTRLRAKLEASASTAVTTPVIAVIEYNYQKDGEIIVPAGAKALGHIEQADRSGYVSIRFDSLLMPDGSSSSFEAVATDMRLRPLKGKVEGKNTGKTVLVRSLSGLGQVGAVLVGRSGGLNGPLSEGDIVRERLGTNIGESADQQVARLSVTERIVVSVDANTPIYVVLDRATKSTSVSNGDRRPATTSQSLDSLRQLLQLQRELNQNMETSSGQTKVVP
jgi:hypothetical protein